MSADQDEKTNPGLEWRTRANGRRVPYWVAKKEYVKAGFPISTVNLQHLADDPVELDARCKVLDAEQKSWAAGNYDDLTYDGTFGSLVKIYQQHEDSPYHDKRADTRRTYDEGFEVAKTLSKKRVATTTAIDIKAEWKEWKAPTARSGGRERLRTAKKGIQAINVALSFGAALKLNGCAALYQAMSFLEWPNGAGRKVAMSFQQASAFIDTAIAMGETMLALAQAIQFECTLRQKDVIGEWEKLKKGETAAFVSGGKKWDRGLVWGTHISRDLILTKETSKTAAAARFDLKRHELVMRVLEHIPDEKRIGPVIMHTAAGRPYFPRWYADRWRNVATKAGIPEDVWNMDSRAGGITETIDAGVSIEQARKQATHASVNTTARYDRATDETTIRIADARAKYRKEPKA
jgi:hypothetical protein